MRARRRRHLRPMGAAIASLVLLMVLAPAAANIQPSTYQIAVIKFDSSTAGGYASCPAGTKIVTGGAGTEASLFGISRSLSSSTPTSDGNGWYAAGGVPPGTQLTILLLCAPATQLADTTLFRITHRNHTGSTIFAGSRKCPPGTTIYGGGGFFHKPFTGPDPHDGGLIFASMPRENGWYFAGFNSASSEMTLSAHCLPNTQIASAVTVTETFTPTGERAGGFARCPAGLRAYSGGAWWHTATSANPSFIGFLVTSFVTSDAGGWYAEGRQLAGGGQFSVTVRCMPG